MNESLHVIIFLVVIVIGWIIADVVCEYRYLWCKGKRGDCHNWLCRRYTAKNEDRQEKQRYTAEFGKGRTLCALEKMGEIIELERRISELEKKLDALYDYVTESKLRESENN